MAEQTDVPREAVAVLERFLEASRRNDETAMRACLSRATLESGNFNAKGPEGVDFVLKEARREGDVVVVPVGLVPTEKDASPMPFDEMPCVLVQEEGAWRLDLQQTMSRLFGEGGLEAMVDGLAEGMKQALEGVGEAIREGFESAFGPGDTSGKASDESTSDEPHPR